MYYKLKEVEDLIEKALETRERGLYELGLLHGMVQVYELIIGKKLVMPIPDVLADDVIAEEDDEDMLQDMIYDTDPEDFEAPVTRGLVLH